MGNIFIFLFGFGKSKKRKKKQKKKKQKQKVNSVLNQSSIYGIIPNGTIIIT